MEDLGGQDLINFFLWQCLTARMTQVTAQKEKFGLWGGGGGTITLSGGESNFDCICSIPLRANYTKYNRRNLQSNATIMFYNSKFKITFEIWLHVSTPKESSSGHKVILKLYGLMMTL
jgi:hypothetical protein